MAITASFTRYVFFVLVLALLSHMACIVHGGAAGSHQLSTLNSEMIRIQDGILPESRSLHRTASDGTELWIKACLPADGAALFRDEDDAFQRWSTWQKRLLDVRVTAAVASEKLNEEKDKEDIPSDASALFDNVLNEELSEEAMLQRQNERQELLAATNDKAPSAILDALAQHERTVLSAMAVRNLVPSQIAASLATTDGLFATLLQDYFTHSFPVASRAQSAGEQVFSSPFSAILRQFQFAFPAVANPTVLSRATQEFDAMDTAYATLLTRFNTSQEQIALSRVHLANGLGRVLNNTAGFLDTLDALGRPLCPVALSSVEHAAAVIQSFLFDPDGRPRDPPDAVLLKRQKLVYRRWRKSITSFCDSKPLQLSRSATRRPSSKRASKRQNDKFAALSADAIAASLSLVVKYRLGDSHGRLSPPTGLPSLPPGVVFDGFTLDELRTHVLPVVGFTAALALVLCLGIFELRLLCLRRHLAERRADEAQSRGARLQLPQPPPPQAKASFSRRAFMVAHIVLILCPWLVAGGVVADQLLHASVPLSSLAPFILSPTGVHYFAVGLIGWVVVSWLISQLVHRYGMLVHSVNGAPSRKAKSE